MLNEDLLDEKDKQIINLTLAVRAYKKYDKERKKYITQLEKRIVELEKMLDLKTKEYDKLLNLDTDKSRWLAIANKKDEKIKRQKEVITILTKKLELLGKPEILNSLSDEKISNLADVHIMKKSYDRLHYKINLLRKFYSDLLAKTVKLQLISEELADNIIGCFPLENEDAKIYEKNEEL